MRSAGRLGGLDLDQRGLGRLALGLLLHLGGEVLGLLLALDHVDAHLVEHRHDVLDLLGRGLVRGQNRIELIEGDIAARLGELDHPLDGGIGEIENRRVGAFGRNVGAVGLVLGGLRFLVFALGCAHLGTGHDVQVLGFAGGVEATA